MFEPTRDGVVVVGADDGGGVLGELGSGAGYRVCFIGNAEHADVVDLVAEHHQATVREARRSLEGVCAVVLGGAGIQNRQVVPERIVVVVAVDLHGIAVAPPDLALQVLNPRQRIDEGEAHHLIVQALAQVVEATQTGS